MTAVARTGCCTPVLYEMADPSKSTVKAALTFSARSAQPWHADQSEGLTLKFIA